MYYVESVNTCFNGKLFGLFLFVFGVIESPAFASQPHPALCELTSIPCATVAMQVLRILNFKISLF